MGGNISCIAINKKKVKERTLDKVDVLTSMQTRLLHNFLRLMSFLHVELVSQKDTCK